MRFFARARAFLSSLSLVARALALPSPPQPPNSVVMTACDINLGTNTFPIYLSAPFLLTLLLGAFAAPCLLAGRVALALAPGGARGARAADGADGARATLVACWARDEDGARVVADSVTQR